MFDLCNVAYFNICKQDAQGCVCAVCVGGGVIKKFHPKNYLKNIPTPLQKIHLISKTSLKCP